MDGGPIHLCSASMVSNDIIDITLSTGIRNCMGAFGRKFGLSAIIIVSQSIAKIAVFILIEIY